MVGEVTLILVDMFSQLFNLQEIVFDSLGAWGLWIGAFLVFTIARFLIVPIVGGVIRGGQSDVVKKIRQSGKSDNVKSQKGDSENG